MQKDDKNGPKIDKNCAKIALFLYIFRICSLKIVTRSKSRGGHVPQCHIAGDASAFSAGTSEFYVRSSATDRKSSVTVF